MSEPYDPALVAMMRKSPTCARTWVTYGFGNTHTTRCVLATGHKGLHRDADGCDWEAAS